MALSKLLQQFEDNAKKDDVYWVEEAKIDFAMDLHRHCKMANINNKALAQKLGTSSAYISKVFRGDANLTIESMVKLARSLNLNLNIQLVEDEVVMLVPQPTNWIINRKTPHLNLVSYTSEVLQEGDLNVLGRFNEKEELMVRYG